MKEKKFLTAMEGIDEDMLDEAKPEMKAENGISTHKGAPILKGGAKKIISVAAGLAILIGITVMLLTMGGDDNIAGVIPQAPERPPSLGPTNYTGIASVVSDYIFSSKGDEFDYDINSGNGTDDGMWDEELSPDAPEGGDSGANGDYSEVTDNQIAGIIEGDLIKATDKYLLRLGEHTLYIYSLDTDGSKLVSKLDIPSFADEFYFGQKELFLSEDGSLATVFHSYTSNKTSMLGAITVDLTDITSPREVGRMSMPAYTSTVRKIDGKFYIAASVRFNRSGIDIDDEKTYIPYINYSESTHVCHSDNLVYPEKIESMTYSYLAVLSERLTLLDDIAILNGGGRAIFMDGGIIFDRQYSLKNESGLNIRHTDASIIDFAGGLSYRGKISMKGVAKDQYSYDRQGDYLRAVVTTHTLNAKQTGLITNASLYVFDVRDSSMVAAVESFAPDGEEATAVRFEGDKLYVCTAVARNFIDPVYFFDLSDYSNITYVDTGYIEGFSSSLIDMGEGYLLGIGRESSREAKLEVYRREGDGVISVGKQLIVGAVSTAYKSYMIDREKNLIGLAYSGLGGYGYAIYTVGEGGISMVADIDLGEVYIDISLARCILREGYAYLTLPKSFHAFAIGKAPAVEITHEHKNSTWVTLSDATCTMGRVEKQVCSCGREQVRVGTPVAHNMLGNSCADCAAKLDDILIFTSKPDGTCSITGLKHAISGDIVIPEKSPKGEYVSEIGASAFRQNELKKVTLPEGIEVIGHSAFRNCCTLESISLPESLKSIGAYAFYLCYGITEIYIPDGVTEIGESAFMFCEKLESVRLPDSLENVEPYLFAYCKKLVKIYIPKSVKEIKEGSFVKCDALTDIYYEGTAEEWAEVIIPTDKPFLAATVHYNSY